MGQFLGFVALESVLTGGFVVTAAGVPTEALALPVYRVYGPNGLMNNGTGTVAYKDSGTITGATNAAPIQITCVSHGLTTGHRVTISGVGGNTAANGTFTIVVTGTDTFTLTGSTGNGAYTSGGTWRVTGLCTLSVTAGAADGYAAGQTYQILVSAASVGGSAWADVLTFMVV